MLCVGWIEPAQTTYLTIYMENLFVRCQAYTLCAKSFSRFLCILIFFFAIYQCTQEYWRNRQVSFCKLSSAF